MRQLLKTARSVFFYSFQNTSVFVKGARMESSWQDWHIKVNYVFGSTTDPHSSRLYPVSTLLQPTMPHSRPPEYKPPEGLYLEGRFKGGFFALAVFFGILR